MRTINHQRQSFYYYAAIDENPLNLLLIHLIDEQFLEALYYGVQYRWRVIYAGRATVLAADALGVPHDAAIKKAYREGDAELHRKLLDEANEVIRRNDPAHQSGADL